MILIRAATPADTPLILSLIQRKAAFDRQIGAFSGQLGVSLARLNRTLFGPKPFAQVLFAEFAEMESSTEAATPMGFALYGFRYSSFAGQPSIWLDDLYVDDAFRSQGAGALLMQQLVQIAQAQDCSHLAWTADARNERGLRFYRRLGAEVVRKEDHRCYFHWTPDVLLTQREVTP